MYVIPDRTGLFHWAISVLLVSVHVVLYLMWSYLVGLHVCYFCDHIVVVVCQMVRDTVTKTSMAVTERDDKVSQTYKQTVRQSDRQTSR